MAEIVIPSVGIAMEEALVVKWLKEPGDDVAADEPVAEIETDKATWISSARSPASSARIFEPGAVVAVGKTVAVVLTNGARRRRRSLPAAGPPVVAGGTQSQPRPRLPRRGAQVSKASGGRTRSAHVRAGSRRRPEPRRGCRCSRQADGRFRELIAAKVSESWREIPHFAVTREVDAEPMLATLWPSSAPAGRDRQADADRPAAAVALRSRSVRPAHRTRSMSASRSRRPTGCDPGRPRRARDRSPSALARARADAVERARAGRLSSDDLASSAVLDALEPRLAAASTSSPGIIALGQTSLLTVGRAVPRVVPRTAIARCGFARRSTRPSTPITERSTAPTPPACSTAFADRCRGHDPAS